MKVKICGLCRPEDARAVARAGADYAGVILAPGGRRQQTPENAHKIFQSAAHLKRVGVFADQSFDEVAVLASHLKLNVIQLHGSESATLVSEIADRTGCTVWKTVWLKTPNDLEDAIGIYGEVAHGLLFDTPHGAERGGTGSQFEWKLAVDARGMIPAKVLMIVAGGLKPENVRAAVELLRPDIVDVASGVEIRMGEKSNDRIDSFVRNAKA